MTYFVIFVVNISAVDRNKRRAKIFVSVLRTVYSGENMENRTSLATFFRFCAFFVIPNSEFSCCVLYLEQIF